MRIGTNPEKKQLSRITYKPHRVIIPVYIPDSKEDYFKNLFEIFKISINSLINTTNKKFTNITIINNNCRPEVTSYIDGLLKENIIDKHVKFSDNYGKIHTILTEAKASLESFITISDADVFFYNGWITETLKTFTIFDKVGVVAPLPMPQLAFYANASLFSKKTFSIKKGSVVDKEDLYLFEKSVNSKIFTKKIDWFKKQFYLEKRQYKVCIGAGHFVGTYKKEIFDKLSIKKPKFVFEDGAERNHLDIPIDQLGYSRVSLINTHAYHLGNTIPEFVNGYHFIKPEYPSVQLKQKKIKEDILSYKMKKGILKIYRKLKSK